MIEAASLSVRPSTWTLWKRDRKVKMTGVQLKLLIIVTINGSVSDLTWQDFETKFRIGKKTHFRSWRSSIEFKHNQKHPRYLVAKYSPLLVLSPCQTSNPFVVGVFTKTLPTNLMNDGRRLFISCLLFDDLKSWEWTNLAKNKLKLVLSYDTKTCCSYHGLHISMTHEKNSTLRVQPCVKLLLEKSFGSEKNQCGLYFSNKILCSSSSWRTTFYQ